MSKLEGTAPILIAHRGYSGRYPENSLLAFEAAYQHGARYVELDLQMTGDQVPVLHHDQTLARMAGVDLDVRDIKVRQFKALKASYAARFGTEFADNSLTTFRRFCKWLKQHPDVNAFVEIKAESLERFGTPLFLDEVYRRIVEEGVDQQCIIISFVVDVIEYTRKVSSMRIGWVLPAWTDENQHAAEILKPDFLFCDKAILPVRDEAVWKGDWQWAIYNLDDVSSAIAMANRGFGFLETNQIGTLLQSAELANRQP